MVVGLLKVINIFLENINELKNQILKLTRDYSKLFTLSLGRMEINYVQNGKGMPIPYAGRVFTDDEVAAAVSSTLDFFG